MTSPTINNLYPVANATTSSRVFVDVFLPRNPTSNDNNYQLQQKWLNTLTDKIWMLVSFTPTASTLLANWVQITGSAGTEELQGNTGGPVGPNGSGIIFTVGDGIGITVAGNPGTNTLTWSLAGGGIATEKFQVDAFTGPGTNPVSPTAGGLITVTGGQVAAGTTGNVIQTNSLAANTYTIQVQRSQAVASSTIADNGVSHFNSAQFTVDSNAFVSLVNPSTSKPINRVNRQVFTTTGTYTPTSGMTYCDIEVVGGGGGSGGCAATGASTFSSSGGGGAGGYARGIFSAATIGASKAVTIGAAGTAGSAGNNNGGAGGTTSVGVLISATGGGGGEGGSANTGLETSFGGAGGSGTNGDFQTTGQPGQSGLQANVSGNGFWAVGGMGGNSFFGGGGPNSGVNSGPATAATSYGGGGGGGGSNVNAAAIAGAAGFAGVVIVTEYISA